MERWLLEGVRGTYSSSHLITLLPLLCKNSDNILLLEIPNKMHSSELQSIYVAGVFLKWSFSLCHKSVFLQSIIVYCFASTFLKADWMYSSFREQMRINSSTWPQYRFYLGNWLFSWHVVVSLQQLVLSHPWGFSSQKIITSETDKVFRAELGIIQDQGYIKILGDHYLK